MRVRAANPARTPVPLARLRRDVTHVASRVRSRTPVPRELALVFVRDRESEALNRRYRRKPRSANVLSFHYGESAELLIAPATVRREARAAGRSYREQLRRGVVHGTLHLLGYHHERSRRQAARFERLEARLLRELGIGSTP